MRTTAILAVMVVVLPVPVPARSIGGLGVLDSFKLANFREEKRE